MPKKSDHFREYLLELKAKHGKVQDRLENFSISNSEDSIIIGDSIYGKIGISKNHILTGSIRGFVTAQAGGGKSYLVRNIIEKFYDNKTGAIIIIDPEGEYYTLREKYDFVILGLESDYDDETRPDVIVTSENIKIIVNLIKKFRMNVIFDLTDADQEPKQNMIAEFIELFLDKNSKKFPTQFFIDEASELARQGDKEKANIRCKFAFKKLAKTGRKRKICAFFNTQRGTQLHKDIVAECNTRLIGYTIEPRDLENYRLLLGYNNKEVSILRTLNHEFMAFGPKFDHSNEYSRPIKFRSMGIKTMHMQNVDKYEIPIPLPNSERVKKWISILTEVNKFEEFEKEIENEITEKQQEPILKDSVIVDTKPIVKRNTSEDEDLKNIVGYFGSISLPDLSLLLQIPYYNKIALGLTAKRFCDKNKDFSVHDEEISYSGPDDFSLKFSSKSIIEFWKNQNSKLIPLISYLYEKENDDNYIDDLKDKFEIQEIENLIKINNNRVYLNPILMFDKENANYNSLGWSETEDFYDDDEDDEDD